MLSGRLLGFNFAAATLAGISFTLAPALEGMSERLHGALAGAGGTGRRRGRSLLVVTQVAVSVLLLIAAGLLGRTLLNLTSVEAGFRLDDLVVAGFDTRQAGFDTDRRQAFFREVTERLAGIDGVVSATVGSEVPLDGVTGASGLFVEGQEVAPGTADQSLIGVGYFATLGVSLVEGREFATEDRRGGRSVAIVNEAFAELFWPAASALGREVAGGVDEDGATIVGVVRDYRHTSLRSEPLPRLYWPIEQRYGFAKDAGTRRVLVHASVPFERIAAAVRSVARDVDPRIPLFELTSMRRHVDGTIAEERQAAALVGAFSSLALALSALGLFGALAYTVASRRREIGIRRALGAGADRVAARVVADGVFLAAVGAIIGLVGAALLSRYLAARLYGVEPGDPMTFAATAGLVLTVAFLASLFPALRATRVDPAIALDNE